MTTEPEQPEQAKGQKIPKKLIPAEFRDNAGKFKPGNPGGVGRRGKRSPLHKAIDDDRCERLWDERARIAENDPDSERRDRAAEFCLRHKTGQPPQASPDIPQLAWPAVMTVDDLAGAVGAVLQAHNDGILDGAGLRFLTSILVDLAKVFEVSDMAPKLRKLEEHVASLGGTL